MCEGCGGRGGLSRRALLGAGLVAGATAWAYPGAPVQASTSASSGPSTGLPDRARQLARLQADAVPIGGGVAIVPRASWGGDLPPKGPLPTEAPGDVRFLLVHHTVNANTYDAGDVPGLLRGIYRFHTGADKGWADLAYNFFVDRHGGVWEGRTGSLTAPVRGDATGGSQGFGLLCCFVGDHQIEPPTPAAIEAMAHLLGWLGATYGLDLAPGATTSFVSRGSQRWPAGSTVTARTIAGHRDMSATTCPGDAAFPLVTDVLPLRAAELVATGVVRPSPGAASPAAGPTTPTSEPPSTPTTTEGAGAPETDPTSTPSTSTPSTSTRSATEASTTVPSTTVPAEPAGAPAVDPAADPDDDAAADDALIPVTTGTPRDPGGTTLTIGLGAAGVIAGSFAGALLWRARRIARHHARQAHHEAETDRLVQELRNQTGESSSGSPL